MPRANKRIPVHEDTFRRAKELKDDGETWDKFLRDRMEGRQRAPAR